MCMTVVGLLQTWSRLNSDPGSSIIIDQSAAPESPPVDLSIGSMQDKIPWSRGKEGSWQRQRLNGQGTGSHRLSTVDYRLS